MTQHDDLTYLTHILDMTESIRRMTLGVAKETLESDETKLFAVLHALQIIGEASRQLAPETRNQLPEVPWSQIIGMRHRIVHDYFGIDFEVVWSALRSDVDPLARAVRNYLSDRS